MGEDDKNKRMKLDIEKFLFLYLKEEAEMEEIEIDEAYNEEILSTNLRRSRGGRKKVGQVGPYSKILASLSSDQI